MFFGTVAPHQVNSYNFGSHLNQLRQRERHRPSSPMGLRHGTGMLRCATCDQPPGAAQRSKQTWRSREIECLESDIFVDNKLPKFATSMKSLLVCQDDLSLVFHGVSVSWKSSKKWSIDHHLHDFSAFQVGRSKSITTGSLATLYKSSINLAPSHHVNPIRSHHVSTLDLDKKLFFLANWINLKAERAR